MVESNDENRSVPAEDPRSREDRLAPPLTVGGALAGLQPPVSSFPRALFLQWIEGAVRALLVIALWAFLVWLATAAVFGASRERPAPATNTPPFPAAPSQAYA